MRIVCTLSFAFVLLTLAACVASAQTPQEPSCEEHLQQEMNRFTNCQVDSVNHCQLQNRKIALQLLQVMSERDMYKKQLEDANKPKEERRMHTPNEPSTPKSQ